MNRRNFLASLGLAPLVARSYFDIGPSWATHGDLWMRANPMFSPEEIENVIRFSYDFNFKTLRWIDASHSARRLWW